MMKVVALYRVSTNQQVDSGLGLDAQERSVRAYCERMGWEIKSSHTDAGVSGLSSIDERTGLLNAIVDCKDPEVSHLVVHKICRLTRDPMIHMTLERLLSKTDTTIISASGEGTGSEEPASVLMRRILSAVNEMEAKTIAKRTSDALLAKRARGEWIGRAPFGFMKVGKTLQRHPEHYQYVVNIHQLRFSSKKTLQEVADLMTEVNTHGLQFTPAKVHRVLKRGMDFL